MPLIFSLKGPSSWVSIQTIIPALTILETVVATATPATSMLKTITIMRFRMVFIMPAIMRM